jgi:predicted O-linked N-acetylglucosamine transferase (SPINDLY family)
MKNIFGWFKSLAGGNGKQGAQSIVQDVEIASPTTSSSTESETYKNQGNAYFGSGKLDEAASCYRKAITISPAYVDAHNNLGLVLQAQGYVEEAEQCLRHALELNPGHSNAAYNLALLLNERGDLDGAKQTLRSGLQGNPDYENFHLLLAEILLVENDLVGAADSFCQALRLVSNHPRALSALAIISFRLGKYELAISQYKNLLVLYPHDAEAHNNMGVALQNIGREKDASACFLRAVEINPEYSEAEKNLAITLQAQGRINEAVDCYRHIIKCNKNYVEAYYNIGNLLLGLGKPGDAISYYKYAIVISPNWAEVHNNLGLAFRSIGKLDDAMVCCKKAVSINPDFYEAYNNLAAILRAKGMLDEALLCCRRAIEIKPGFAPAHNNLGNVLFGQGRLDEAISCYQEALKIDPNAIETHSCLLFYKNYDQKLSGEELFAAYQEWNCRHAERFFHYFEYFINSRDLRRRLRVGYVSPDFRNHSVAFFAAPLIEQHDRNCIEVFCYYNHLQHDQVSDRLKKAADHWVPTTTMSDEQLAQRIRDDKIDVLVDLAGHSSGNRLLVFARKPAPIQVSWMGFGYTTGLTAIDYFIGDEVLTPPGSDALFSEEIYRLPRPFVCYQPPELAPSPSVLPAIKNGYVTFACLSRAERINERVIEAWAEILRRLPGSHLRLDSRSFESDSLCSGIKTRFAALGIAESRIEVGFTSPVWVVYQDVDIVLDCFPHNSGTTTCEALWMGVPVVTLADRPSVGRLGACYLSAVGKAEWIATDVSGYVDLAVQVAQDTAGLINSRAALREAMRDSPLLDHEGFVRDMEYAYRDMWQQWCEEANAGEHRSLPEVLSPE